MNCTLHIQYLLNQHKSWPNYRDRGSWHGQRAQRLIAVDFHAGTSRRNGDLWNQMLNMTNWIQLGKSLKMSWSDIETQNPEESVGASVPFLADCVMDPSLWHTTPVVISVVKHHVPSRVSGQWSDVECWDDSSSDQCSACVYIIMHRHTCAIYIYV